MIARPDSPQQSENTIPKIPDKWHPFPWQTTNWQAIYRLFCSGEMAHALLLNGVPGVGKNHFAYAMAIRILCEDKSMMFPCGHCKSCHLIEGGFHPDLFLVSPVALGKQIKIDQIRQVNEFVRKTAQQGGQRVILITSAESMNINAANALLKVLEEPGNDTLFLLVSDRSGDMLPTIRSRCQTLTFTVPSRDEAMAWLSTHIADEQIASQLLDLAAGAPENARILFDNDGLVLRSKLINGMSDLFRGNITPVELSVAMLKEWQDRDITELLGWLVSWLDDAIRIALSVDISAIRNRDLSKMLSYVAQKSSGKELFCFRDQVAKQRHQLLEGGNLNTQLMMEGVFCGYLGLVV